MNPHALDGETLGSAAIGQAAGPIVITNEKAMMSSRGVDGEAFLSQDDYPQLLANIASLESQVGELKTALEQKSVLLAKARGAHKLAQEALLRSEERFMRPHESPPVDTLTGADGMSNPPGIARTSVESRQAQAELYESEKRFRQLVEGATEGIYINTGQRFRYLNAAALSLFGADAPEQLVGQSVLDRYHPHYRAVAAERMRILLEELTAVPVIEQQCFRLDGTVFDVEVSAVPFSFEGRDGAVVYIRDITARKKSEQDRTSFLQHAKELAEATSRHKSDFLANMSHEIRTPMHGVLGTLELLSETGLSEQQSDFLDTARNSSNSLLALLNDILDLSKMEAGRMELHVAPFSLRQTVVEVTRLLQAQANVQGITLSPSYGPGLPEYFEGDEMRVRQIVFNLAGNAVKFTTEGQVAIEISGQQKPDGLWSLRIAVRDSGIGIPQDCIPQLFQDFVQVNSAASRRFAGSGLGLAICQRLVTMMDGSISVESELGRGSTFSFLVELPQAVPVAKADQATEQIPTNRLFDAHILLAEDNRVNQKLAINMLTRLGCRVTLAQNGREAVELAEQLHFPIILMDCQMPEMDGFEASRLIRSGLGDEPVIIALTANSLHGDRERCIEAGMNDYLAKPFQRSDLVRLLDRYLPIVQSAETDAESEITTTQ